MLSNQDEKGLGFLVIVGKELSFFFPDLQPTTTTAAAAAAASYQV